MLFDPMMLSLPTALALFICPLLFALDLDFVPLLIRLYI